MHRNRLLWISFSESFAAVVLERGVYFYTEDRFGYGDIPNLALALGFGITYVIGALLSHRLAVRFGERRAMVLSVVALLVLHALLALAPTPVVAVGTLILVGLFTGLKWPVIESFMSAGLTSRQMLRMVGRFCFTWSVAVPLAVAVAGPLIDSPYPPALFWLAVVCHALSLWLMRPLPAHPTHAPHDDPGLPDPARQARYTQLLGSARWSLMLAYTLLFLVAPLLPTIFSQRLGLPPRIATPAASLMDAMRVVAFIALTWATFWYGRISPLVLVILGLPTTVALIVFGQTLPTVLLGEVAFGLISGLGYYAALYYALACKNAAVEAGGVHEALIGAGFALGPLVGLMGIGLADVTGGYVLGMLLGVGPLVLIGSIAAAWPLIKLLRVQRSR